MIYKQFQDRKLSALGFGCMRLPTVDGNDANVNEAEAAQLIAQAMEGGVNYCVISYRLYGNSPAARKGAYLKTFTVYNLVFLAILYGAAMLLLAR